MNRFHVPDRGSRRVRQVAPASVVLHYPPTSAPGADLTCVSRRWLLSLGILATALLITPHLVGAQGLRSTSVTISLTAIARPRAETLVRGASVTDVILAHPTSPLPVARVEVRLEAGPADEPTLWVRGGDGHLQRLGSAWRSVSVSGSTLFRAIAADGGTLGGAIWRVRYRMTPSDSTSPSFEESRDVTVPSKR